MEILILVLMLLGLGVGIGLQKIAPEEIAPGRKYIGWFRHGAFLAALALPFAVMEWKLIFYVILVVAAMYCLFALPQWQWITSMVIFSLTFFFFLPPPLLLPYASLSFLSLMAEGSLLAFQKKKAKR